MREVRCGYHPDPDKGVGATPDRDFGELRLAARRMPAETSLREHVVEVLDQGTLGSCVAHSVMQAIRIAHHRMGEARPELGSRLFCYFAARAATGETATDAGTTIRAALDGIRKLGFPPETAWPYSDEAAPFRRMPSGRAFRLAFDQRRPTTYRRIYPRDESRLSTVMRALVAGFAVSFGVDVDTEFCNGFDFSKPRRAMKGTAGGHAMLITGYREDGAAFEVLNSWGTSWGQGGYFWAAPSLIMAADDLWTIERAPALPKGES